MKLKLFIFETKAPEWVEIARQEYTAKLKGFQPFEIHLLKSPSADRENAEVKKKKEAEILLRQIDEKDLLILFDEAGEEFRSSEEFAKHLSRHLESGKARIAFCIGGPYGFDASVTARSQAQWSLSKLTLNHWVAQVTALEQIFRGLTIIKGIPYHNR